MAVCSKTKNTPLSRPRQADFPGSSYPTITHKGKGTTPLLDKLEKPYVCQPPCPVAK